jgi:hypothetical protein
MDKIEKFTFHFVDIMDGKQIIANLKKYIFLNTACEQTTEKRKLRPSICLNNLCLHSVWQLTWLQRELDGASSPAQIKPTEKNKDKPGTHRGFF